MTSSSGPLDRPWELPSDDVLFRAQLLTENVPKGKWWWGGNTDNGDITLHGYMGGHGWIDILRQCVDPITPEERRQAWEVHGLSEYYDSYEDYLDSHENEPDRQSLAIWSDVNEGCVDIHA